MQYIYVPLTAFRSNDVRDCPESKLIVRSQRISIKIQESGSYKSVEEAPTLSIRPRLDRLDVSIL